MSLKVARGTKRVCQNCGSKFYDLNRSPIACPICQTVFQQEARAKVAAGGNAQDDDDDDVLVRPVDAVVDPLADAAAGEADLPDLEDTELVDLGEDEADLKGDADETFIEEEDDSGDDVSGLLGAPREDDEEV